jgi:hypothetical protein
MKAEDVLGAMRKRHDPPGREWAFFDELRAGTGYTPIWKHDPKYHDIFNPEQRYDAWAINLFPSKKYLRVAYEIKVDRSDFLHEIQNPKKRKQALEVSNQYYFATPKGLVDESEIPEECGLIEVSEKGNSRVKIKAPFRETDGLSWQFLCSIARRISKEEDESK